MVHINVLAWSLRSAVYGAIAIERHIGLFQKRRNFVLGSMCLSYRDLTYYTQLGENDKTE